MITQAFLAITLLSIVFFSFDTVAFAQGVDRGTSAQSEAPARVVMGKSARAKNTAPVTPILHTQSAVVTSDISASQHDPIETGMLSTSSLDVVYEALNATSFYNSQTPASNVKGEFGMGDVWVASGEIVSVATILDQGMHIRDYSRSCACDDVGERITPPAAAIGGGAIFALQHFDSLSADWSDLKGLELIYLHGSVNQAFLIYSYTLFALIMFLAGWYLRFRSDNAPGYGVIIS